MSAKIPKYIIDAVKLRYRYAKQYNDQDSIISDWCNKNGISIEYTNSHIATICGGPETVTETLNQIAEALENKNAKVIDMADSLGEQLVLGRQKISDRNPVRKNAYPTQQAPNAKDPQA